MLAKLGNEITFTDHAGNQQTGHFVMDARNKWEVIESHDTCEKKYCEGHAVLVLANNKLYWVCTMTNEE